MSNSTSVLSNRHSLAWHEALWVALIVSAANLSQNLKPTHKARAVLDKVLPSIVIYRYRKENSNYMCFST